MAITLEQLLADYHDQNARSHALFQRASASLPGGNTRTGVFVDPFPLYAEKGEGAYVYDADGNARLDFVNNATALILGHAHPDVVAALRERAGLGTAFYAPTAAEIEWAECLRKRMPALEHLRFCSSGTETVANALRVARAFTGRPKIAKFEGAYHGIDDAALISYLPPLGPDLGPEDAPRPVAAAQGLSPGVRENVIVLPFNDLKACERLLRQHAKDLAAVIIDPLSTAAGLALPDADFLPGLRTLTRDLDILLIFDEIVSFRMGAGGTQVACDICPDITCLGKVIAGGTPGGAFGGRADLMALYDPTSGPPAIPQSGTYNGNPLVAAAGLATLNALTPEAYAHLSALTRRIAIGLTNAFQEQGIPGCVVIAGSLFRIYFLDQPPRNYRQAARDDKEKHRWLYFWLLNQGIITRQGGCTSLPMTDAHTDTLVQAVREGLTAWPF